MSRHLKSLVARGGVADTVISVLERADAHRPNQLRVLTYHRVGEMDDFDAHAAYLAANYHVISMGELLDVYRRGSVLKPRAVLVTFDDGYRDFEEHAWPVLSRHGLPVTVFVPTAFPDRPEQTLWWQWLAAATRHTDRREPLETPAGQLPLATASERERAFRRLRTLAKALPHHDAIAMIEEVCSRLEVPAPPHDVLDWTTLRRLARAGVTLGAHSRTHALLDRLPLEAARAEAVESLRDLEREVGSVPPVFAYPGGKFTDGLVRELEREGFALAFTMVRGTNHLDRADPLRLRRINIGERASLTVLRARLLHASPYLNRWRPLERPDDGTRSVAERTLNTTKERRWQHQ